MLNNSLSKVILSMSVAYQSPWG